MRSIRFRLVITAILAAVVTVGTAGFAQGYGTYRIGHVSFLSEPGIGYAIMSDCSIQAYGRTVARVRPSYDPSFVWIYFNPSQGASYGVDRRGSVWGTYAGQWIIVGHAVWTAGCF